MKSLQVLLFVIIITTITGNFVFAQENLLPRISAPVIELFPAPPVSELESSTIEIPLKFPLDGAFNGIEERIPRLDFNRKWLINGWTGLKYKTWRDSINFSINRNLLTTKTDFFYQVKREKGFKLAPPFSYIARFLYRDQCGSKHQKFGASTSIDTEFNLDHKWGLISKTQGIKSFYTINLCPLKFGQQMAADVAMQPRQQQIGSLAKGINEEINKIDFHPNAEKAWKMLNTPISVESPSIWLSFNPETIAFSLPQGESSSISTTMFINVKPRIEMTTSKPKDFPQLPIDEKNQNFQIVAEHHVSFDDASDDLEDQLLGKEFKLATKNIQITGVKLTGSGTKTIIKVRFRGDLIGTIYLRGEITFDQPTKSLVIKNLDFTDETKETLNEEFNVDSFDWHTNTSLFSELETVSKWNLNAELNQDTQQLNTKISKSGNGKESFVSKLSTGEILQVFAEDDDIVIRFKAEGSVILQLN